MGVEEKGGGGGVVVRIWGNVGEEGAVVFKQTLLHALTDFCYFSILYLSLHPYL